MSLDLAYSPVIQTFQNRKNQKCPFPCQVLDTAHFLLFSTQHSCHGQSDRTHLHTKREEKRGQVQRGESEGNQPGEPLAEADMSSHAQGQMPHRRHEHPVQRHCCLPALSPCRAVAATSARGIHRQGSCVGQFGVNCSGKPEQLSKTPKPIEHLSVTEQRSQLPPPVAPILQHHGLGRFIFQGLLVCAVTGRAALL